ncbi:hypothetical protein BDV12DRAFT_205846 [Aspergillus spectabilis]
MSTPRRRYHGGCWTCKASHRKCDRAHPTCHACNQRGVSCEGYEVRLRWGSGIASRGRFTGAEVPVESCISPRVKGRRRDELHERQRQFQAAVSFEEGSGPVREDYPVDSEIGAVHSSLRAPDIPSEDAQLFREFLSSGINILHSTSVHDVENLLRLRLPTLAQQSDALYFICITLQVSLTPVMKPHFFEYFDAALTKFRSELSRNNTYLKEGTMAAGLLLCTIGVMHGIPWTMHLRGMDSILKLNGLDNTPGQDRAFRAHLFEVMGIMDLPTFAIGRQYTHLGFWRQHCRNRGLTDEPSQQYDVEVVSGLPRSLVDIFSCIGEGATENDFWNWPGAQGSFLQCQLWEAYRLAGMLAVRHGDLHLPFFGESGFHSREPRIEHTQRKWVPPSSGVIVSRVLSCVDAIPRASVEPEGRDTLIINAIHYPTFVAGLRTDIMAKDPSLKGAVRRMLSLTAHEPFWINQFQLMLDLLEEYWTYTTGTISIHQLAQAREIELGLF